MHKGLGGRFTWWGSLGEEGVAGTGGWGGSDCVVYKSLAFADHLSSNVCHANRKILASPQRLPSIIVVAVDSSVFPKRSPMHLSSATIQRGRAVSEALRSL
ncbi:hypothetical protein BaRGS_00040150 [Batillaria attramentaria]|uniref:Uncharacterized protein n=1 Tax=Batillaria attramentaria TaxID=370345 RepID=A0ABD0J1P2_9CAEN